jgi:hypothetical protein
MMHEKTAMLRAQHGSFFLMHPEKKQGVVLAYVAAS